MTGLVNYQRTRPDIPIAVPSGAAFQTPDIANNQGFETGFEGWTSWAGPGNDPDNGIVRDNTLSKAGSWSIKFPWTPNPGGDIGGHCIYNYGAVVSAAKNRVWMRWYFRITQNISTTWKFWRYYDSGFNDPRGGIFIDSGSNIAKWGWDLENGGITTTIGLAEASVIDGNWHSFEVDYWRNGDPSGWPSAQIWFDGSVAALADGTPVEGQGAGNSSYWLGGRIYAGVRNTPSSGNADIGYQQIMGTLNGGNTTTGQGNIDVISISSLGRIGP